MDWQIHGHDWVVEMLTAHVAGNNLRHAYLFVGPAAIGRRTLALRFSQALNCSAPVSPGQFCGTCRDCKQMYAMVHPDLSILAPEEGHLEVLIDQVRALQHTLALSPYAAPYRIALLEDFQRATIQSQNALLKTLEEPADKVVLLLTADAPESLLPTIVSRCEVIRLRPASIDDTQSFLQSSRGVDPDQAARIAHLSGGRIGAAIQMVEDPSVLESRQEHLAVFLALLAGHRYERFDLAETLSKPNNIARQKVGEVLPIWLSFWRDVFVRTSGASLPLVNYDLEPQIDLVASKVDAYLARRLVIAHEEAVRQLAAYANVRLLVEALMLQWPYFSTPLPVI